MTQLILEQLVNGLQLGMFLCLVAAGLTLVFGFMNIINLAHGSLFMIGAYAVAYFTGLTGSFFVGLILIFPVVAIFAFLIEFLIIRPLYYRDHLDQVLATFGLILFFNEGVSMVFGRTPLFLNVPEVLSGAVRITEDFSYPLYRIAIIAVGAIVAVILWFIIAWTKTGMRIRAGTTNPEIIRALGVNIQALNSMIFVVGALFAGLAGAMSGPLTSVEVGMGENLLILCFVCIVIGGIGSIRGALFGALIVGIVDTLGRAFLPDILGQFLNPASANGIGAALSSMSVYLLMTIVLVVRPTGLCPVARAA